MGNNIAIVTDSNSGITEKEANNMGITIIPMPFYINNKTYHEGLDLSHKEFYNYLENNAEVRTSQPAPGSVTEVWDELLKEKESIVYIPMSSSLSGSYQISEMLSQEYEGKVQVIDNKRISVTQLQSVKDALNLSKEGKTAKEIKSILEDKQYNSSIYIVLDTLEFLKKGGRITPAAASIAKVLNIKPVLQIQGEKLDSFKKARGIKQAKRIMKDAIKDDLKERFSGINNMKIYAAYSSDKEMGELWLKELSEEFPNYEVEMYPLSLSVGCHIGPNAIGVACVEKIV